MGGEAARFVKSCSVFPSATTSSNKMPSDNELLQSYVRDRSHEAFGELVRRHVDLVY